MVPHLWLYLRYNWWNKVNFSSTRITFDILSFFSWQLLNDISVLLFFNYIATSDFNLPESRFLIIILVFDWFAISRSGVVTRLACPLRSRAFASILKVCHSASLKMRISPRNSSFRRVSRRSPFCQSGVLLEITIRETWNMNIAVYIILGQQHCSVTHKLHVFHLLVQQTVWRRMWNL